MYDYLIVGSGIYGCVFAHEAQKRGFKCLLIEKRPHIGGNSRTDNIEGINVHTYGAHIFHTKNKEVWEYVNKFADFNSYTHTVLANYNGEIFNLPFNLNTFNKFWGLTKPEEVKYKIEKETGNIIVPNNLEEQAISLVGKELYSKLIKEYTEKQWGRDCKELPSFIIKRIPLRFSYNNKYFDDPYQGIPIGGYTNIFNKLVENVEVMTDTDYFKNREYFDKIAKNIVYTGPIDKYYDYCFGKLQYRSLEFETKVLNMPNYQGASVMNFTSKNEQYTRIIEHKHFECLTNDAIYKNPITVITKEYPRQFNGENDAFYPINDEINNRIYNQYKELSKKTNNIIFGGRLTEYKYYNMDQVFENVLNYWKNIWKKAY